MNGVLDRLQTNYLDNYHLHAVYDSDLEKRVGPNGALEALIEAKKEGLIRHIGCTSHLSSVLIKALEHYDFEIILVPMNIVEQEPLKALIPLCNKKGAEMGWKERICHRRHRMLQPQHAANRILSGQDSALHGSWDRNSKRLWKSGAIRP